MMEVGRNGEQVAVAGAWTSFRQQTWLLAVSGRWLFWIVGLGTLRLLAAAVGPEVPPLILTGLLPVHGAVVWALLVWRGEPPQRRSYHWSLPVSRPVHDLARVAAGAWFLVVACALWAGFELAIASPSDLPEDLLGLGLQAWARLAVAPLVAYLLATPFVLWADCAITRWLLGARMVPGAPGRDPRRARVRPPAPSGPAGARHRRRRPRKRPRAPGVARELGHGSAWWVAAPLWLAVGAALTALAARYRPGDLRRRVRGRGHGTR